MWESESILARMLMSGREEHLAEGKSQALILVPGSRFTIFSRSSVTANRPSSLGRQINGVTETCMGYNSYTYATVSKPLRGNWGAGGSESGSEQKRTGCADTTPNEVAPIELAGRKSDAWRNGRNE